MQGTTHFKPKASGRRLDQDNDMSIKHNVVFLIAAFVFGSLSTVVAAGNANNLGAAADARAGRTGVNACDATVAASSDENDTTEQASHLSRQAPVGHRQPRAGDVPANTQLPVSEFEQRRLDQDLDRRLIIRRGC
jgi:hypothetical protein